MNLRDTRVQRRIDRRVERRAWRRVRVRILNQMQRDFRAVQETIAARLQPAIEEAAAAIVAFGEVLTEEPAEET